MNQEPAPPLGPPPRKARLHRNIRNLRRAYRSIFALLIFVFAGWAALDGWRLYELSYGTVSANAGADHWLGDNESARTQARFMIICRGLAALIVLIVFVVIERPLRAEVWLARHGVVAQGQILATGQGRRKRSKPWIKYVFCTASGDMVEGKSFLPRATPAEVLGVGRPIEVLYDPRHPRRNKARLAMTSVEFGV